MATKSNLLFSSLDKQFISASITQSNVHDARRYGNLNLNQNQKYLNANYASSKSISTNNSKTQSFDHRFVHDDSRLKSSKSSWNMNDKSNLFKSMNLQNLEEMNENQKLQSRVKSSITSSSTLSLHIAAYEEDKSENCQADTIQRSFGLSLAAENLHNFPRQQECEVSYPEIMQFKTSQKLFSPQGSRSMASFITRVERAAPIFSRVTGLIRSGQMKWENRPLWYDVYAAVPPYEEPVWDLKMPKADDPIRSVMYKEDTIRARFYSQFRNSGITAVENSSKPTLCEQFITQVEEERKANPELNEDQLFDRASNVLIEHGLLKKNIQ